MSQANKIDVVIVDVTGNKEQGATLPTDVPMGRIIEKLVEVMQLPMTAPDGQPLNYKLHHKASGRQLTDEDTLESAGVKDNDYLRLQPEIIAG